MFLFSASRGFGDDFVANRDAGWRLTRQNTVLVMILSLVTDSRMLATRDADFIIMQKSIDAMPSKLRCSNDSRDIYLVYGAIGQAQGVSAGFHATVVMIRTGLPASLSIRFTTSHTAPWSIHF